MTNGKTTLQNRYTLLQVLGQGGMGTVYLAEDGRLAGRMVAVKQLSLAHIPASEREARLHAFRQEAIMLGRLQHPGIAAVSDFFFETGNAYLVMDYIPGPTLRQHLWQRPGHRLPTVEVLAFTRQLCQVLAYLHRQEPPLIFRDLKPENIIVQPDGQLKLIDFGIARLFKSGQQKDTVTMGTPGYASPEQYGQGQTDARSDIYSLGIVLHEMLTGQDPSHRTPFMPLEWSDVSGNGRLPALKTVISKATQLDPNMRYQSVAEMEANLPDLAVPDPPSRFPVWAAVSAALLLLLLLVGGAWLMGRDSDSPGTVAVQTVVVSVAEVEEETAVADPTAAATIPPTVTPAPTNTPEPTPEINEPTVFPLPGNQLTALTDDPADQYVASLSPDQQRFVFMSNRSGTWQIYTAAVSGAGWQPLTPNNVDNYHPRYAPDGQRIVLASRESGEWEIYSMAVNGQDWQRLTFHNGPDFYPSYDPTGEWIVYMSQRDGEWGIYLMRADGSDNRLVRTTAVESFPLFAPDGESIVFMDSVGGNVDIYTTPLGGSSVTRLTTHPARDANPVYSPDGEWVVFESNRGGNYDIYAMRPDGSDVRNLTNHPADDQIPAISPDGQWLIFQSRRGGSWDIYRQPFPDHTAESTTTVVELSVSAVQARTETGLTVQPSQQVLVETMAGSWRAGPLPTWPLVGPEGDPQVASKSTFPVANAPVMTLIVGVGEERPLPVGQRLEFTSPTGGMLWLGPNDDNVDDNGGNITVRITIRD